MPKETNESPNILTAESQEEEVDVEALLKEQEEEQFAHLEKPKDH